VFISKQIILILIASVVFSKKAMKLVVINSDTQIFWCSSVLEILLDPSFARKVKFD